MLQWSTWPLRCWVPLIYITKKLFSHADRNAEIENCVKEVWYQITGDRATHITATIMIPKKLRNLQDHLTHWSLTSSHKVCSTSSEDKPNIEQATSFSVIVDRTALNLHTRPCERSYFILYQFYQLVLHCVQFWVLQDVFKNCLEYSFLCESTCLLV